MLKVARAEMVIAMIRMTGGLEEVPGPRRAGEQVARVVAAARKPMTAGMVRPGPVELPVGLEVTAEILA